MSKYEPQNVVKAIHEVKALLQECLAELVRIRVALEKNK